MLDTSWEINPSRWTGDEVLFRVLCTPEADVAVASARVAGEAVPKDAGELVGRHIEQHGHRHALPVRPGHLDPPDRPPRCRDRA